jgi:hypothetical protein
MYGMTAELADVRVTKLKQFEFTLAEKSRIQSTKSHSVILPLNFLVGDMFAYTSLHSALAKLRNARRRAEKGLLRRSPGSISGMVG